MSLFDRLQGEKAKKLNEEKEKGATFLATNKTKEGVIELPEGVQYQMVEEGTGKQPAVSTLIEAHYAGRLLDGKEFDSSFRRNQPFQARINQLIIGWQLVLPLVKEGGRVIIWVPSDLGYGDNGVPGIPGGAVLEFEVQLLRILS
ncbi:FKBP-type peptidyl-prolyl cis-trans isomerase FklB [Cnuella takakiae]|uniref:Peptidyl-prolyl cis-trans isomerase n=1 Tax=Cnuella takakiae TaxID=1302690 RepID=A0A1M5HKS4_9BACT|nr:FKBP-type peptidyl-prolyl cis-trans isomerase [Cnuella takakiae]OLY92904.1 peptidylprolyl isomerase [Cnuella takakiae]SHG16432.1 FKBP-type peptidyl-prolyl cis-trans isomerase FklB [Cnuella takakiae]